MAVVSLLQLLAVACSPLSNDVRAVFCDSQDTTFEFERRRNVLDKYDRENMQATIKAMQRISEIQQRRQDRFYQNRMKGRKSSQKIQVCFGMLVGS